MDLLLTIGLCIALALVSIIDIRERRLPDIITLPLAAIGISTGFMAGATSGAVSVLGLVFGFLFFWLISTLYTRLTGRHGLGAGDAKLLAAAGAWLGPFFLGPVVFFSASLAVLFVACWRTAGRQLSWQSTLPFGPFLGAGFLICWCAKLNGLALA